MSKKMLALKPCHSDKALREDQKVHDLSNWNFLISVQKLRLFFLIFNFSESLDNGFLYFIYFFFQKTLFNFAYWFLIWRE
jgi:hypothetical protein